MWSQKWFFYGITWRTFWSTIIFKSVWFFSSFLISSSTPDKLRLPQKALVTLWWHCFFSIKVVTFHWLLLLSQTSFCNEFLSTPHKSNPYVNLSAFYYCHLDIICCVYLAYFLLLSPQFRQKRIQKHNYSNKTLLQKLLVAIKHIQWIPLVNSAMHVVSEENLL